MSQNKQRLQTDLGPGPDRLKPVASPVDTFVRTQAGQQLSQLAQGLSTLSPALSRFSDTVAAEKSASEQAKGEQDARNAIEANKSYLDAIKAGDMKAADSPWYQLAFKEQYGRVAAQKYSAQLASNLAQSNVADSTDPADFDKFEQDQRLQFLEDNFGDKGKDSTIANAFGRAADNLVAGHRNAFAEGAASRLERDFGENLHQEVFQGITASAGHVDADTMAKTIQLALDRAVAPGHNAGQANRTVVSAVVEAAQRLNDTSILKLLDNVYTNSKGAKLGATSYASAAIEQAENQIVVKTQSQWAFDQNVKAKQEKEEVEKQSQAIVEELLAVPNPSAIDLTDSLKKIGKIDSGAVADILQIRDRISSGLSINDDEAIKDELASIWNGRGSRKRILKLMADGHINQQGFTLLNSQLEQRIGADREGANFAAGMQSRVFNDPLFESSRSQFEGLFGSGLMDAFDPDKALRKDRAVSEFNRQWVEWVNTSGKAGDMDAKIKFLNTLTEHLRTTYGNPDTISDASAVPSVPGLQKDWHKESVLSPTALAGLENRLHTGQPTIDDARLLRGYGIDPRAAGQFLSTQRALLTQPTGKK